MARGRGITSQMLRRIQEFAPHGKLLRNQGCAHLAGARGQVMAMTASPEAATGRPGIVACPACIATPSAQALAAGGRGGDASAGRLLLSVPGAHCAACIATVEGALAALPGVRAARLNLTQRRVRVDAAPGIDAAMLVAALARAGYEAQELDESALATEAGDRVGRDLLMRLAVAFFAMMNVMLLSVAVWSGAEGATRDVFHWISAAIALPTVAFAGQPFFRAAWAGLRAGRVVMDFPISLALVLASAISIYETAQSGEQAYFDAAVMLCFFLLIGRYLDHRTRALARSAAQELAALEVPRATVLEDGGVEVVRPIAQVRPGERVLVRPGERLPVDGVVETGTSEVDRSLLTGESLPAFVGPGAELAAGEVNLTGPLTLRVTSAGRDTSLGRIAELVAVAEAARTRHKSLAERASRIYSPLVHTLALSAFGWWMWASGGDIRLALNIAAAVLIITCPCALGLAVPAVVTAASGQLFRRGVLIKHGTALERMAEVDTVVFDKTGTLTMGTPEATNLDAHPAQAVAVARALAQASAHPLARALVSAAGRAGIAPADVDALHEIPGHGIEGMWQGRRVRLGRAEWCGAAATADTATHLAIEAGEGAGAEIHSFTFADRMRPGAAEAVATLLRSGRRVILLSGDSAPAVSGMASRLGIAEWQAGALPEEKAARIESLAAAGQRVLMVGDGLNDTAALAGAHVSISPASALDAARVASDIVLLGRSLAPIADALRIARQSRSRILQNFAISGGYNVIAVPLALAGHATPLAAALAMSLSSITVSLNALRLR